jgi:hypothetical protein
MCWSTTCNLENPSILSLEYRVWNELFVVLLCKLTTPNDSYHLQHALSFITPAGRGVPSEIPL